MTARHTGKHGDIIFSMPTLKALGVDKLYIPEWTKDECTNLFSGMRSFLSDYGIEAIEYPSGGWYGELAEGVSFDYDMDNARHQPWKGVVHIVKRYMDEFKIKGNWQSPWLGPSLPGNYTLINFTNRHLDNDNTDYCRVDWGRVNEQITGEKYFVGTLFEWEYFTKKYGHIGYLPHFDIASLAKTVQHAKDIYCNQSLVLALAQGFGKEYWCQFKKGKTNCMIYTPNEHPL